MNIDKSTLVKALIVVLVIIGATFAIYKMSSNDQPAAKQQASVDAAKFKKEYPNVSSGNLFTYASKQQVLDIFDHGSGVIFLGFPKCPWCQQLAPIVDAAAKEAKIDKIYYLDIRQAREDNDELYRKLLNILKPRLRKDKNGKPRIYLPDVSVVRKGKIVGHFVQEVMVDGKKATPDEYWTVGRREKATQDFVDMMELMKASDFDNIARDVESGALLLDVRTAQEFEAGHFEGATNLDVVDIQKGKKPDVDKLTQIYVYCRSGNRSSVATELLKEAGFKNIRDLGGLADVQRLGGKLK